MTKRPAWIVFAVLVSVVFGIVIAANTSDQDNVQLNSGYSPPGEGDAPPAVPSELQGPSVTYTKPMDSSRQHVDEGVLVSSTYTTTIESPDGTYPIQQVRDALETADGVMVTGMEIPWHACNDASDCEAEVDQVCRDNEAGGRAVFSLVLIQWNSRVGFGYCDGCCADGGTVHITCLQIH